MNQTGASLLKQHVEAYREEHGVTQEWIALNCLLTTNASLSAWMNGKSAPETKHRAIIAIWTGGEVPAAAWFSVRDCADMKRIRVGREAAPAREAA